MEAADEVTANIVKGKRTKRQRVQSPIPFAIATSSSSIDGVADGIGEITDENAEINDGNGEITYGIVGGDVNDGLNAKNSTNVFPTTSSQEFLQSTDEEEDMANCLILLAQGHFKDLPPKVQDEDCIAAAGGIYNTSSNNNNNILPSSTAALMANTGNKFNSRRFMETTGSAGSGKSGYYVYECKTCCRTFPSFQALGGHRASHKKPKGIMNNYNYDEKKQFTANSSDEEDVHNYKDSSSLSLQFTNNSNTNNTRSSSSMNLQHNKTKIHECSICGAEFTSGQALGGHMRRHRAVTTAASNTKNLSLTPMAMESNQPKNSRNLLSLGLDLNLPAPDDEKLTRFASNQQQPQQQKQDQQQQKPPLVFSGPALVDCHY